MGLARSGFVWTVLRVAILFSSWLALAFFTRVIPEPDQVLGQYYLFETFVAFFVLLSNAGINQATTKRISEGQDQSKYVGGSILMSIVVLLIVTAAILIGSNLIESQFSTRLPVVLILLGTLWGRQLIETTRSALEGYAKIEASGSLDLIEIVIKLGIQIALVILGDDLIGLLVGTMASSLTLGIIGLLYLVHISDIPTLEKIAHLFDYSKYAFLKEFTTKFYDNVDTIALAVFLGDAAVGLYNVAFRFSIVINIIPHAVGVVSFPEISENFAGGNLERVREVVHDGLIVSTMIAIPGTMGMAVIAREVILVLYTSTFLPAVTVAIVAVAISIPNSFLYVFTHVVEGIDRPEISLKAGLLLIGTNIILDILLIPIIGIDGAVTASFVGISLAAIYAGREMLRILEADITYLPYGMILKQLLAAAVMGGVVAVVKSLLVVSTPVLVVVLVSTGVIVYFVVLFVISPDSRLVVFALIRSIQP